MITARRDWRIPLLVGILLIAATVYQMRTRTTETPRPVLKPVEHLAMAESIHQTIADSLTRDPAASVARSIDKAMQHYRFAAAAADSFTSSRAAFGKGQLLLLSGDTVSAIAAWQEVVTLGSDGFATMRALKAMADAEESSGDTVAAGAHYGEIVRIFGDSELTQAGLLVVKAARMRLVSH